MSDFTSPPEPNNESGLWIAVKVGLFVAIPILLVYAVKLFTD